jgi:CRP/FNR family nitrogen fixation transcriptional regulator
VDAGTDEPRLIEEALMQTALATTGLNPVAPAVLIRSGGIAAEPRAEAHVLPMGIARSVHKDEEIYGEGDEARWYFKVTAGVVRTCKILNDGRRQIEAFHVAGDLFGIERGADYRSSAEAVGEATVVAYRRCSLEILAAGDTTLARQVVATALLNLERAQQHMILLGRKSATEKVATFLLEMADRVHVDAIELPMSRGDIADYLGLTIETVSRTLTQLERDGVIAVPTVRRNIVLRNKAALRRLNA